MEHTLPWFKFQISLLLHVTETFLQFCQKVFFSLFLMIEDFTCAAVHINLLCCKPTLPEITYHMQIVNITISRMQTNEVLSVLLQNFFCPGSF